MHNSYEIKNCFEIQGTTVTLYVWRGSIVRKSSSLSKEECIPFWNPKRLGKHLALWCLGVLELYASSWVFPGMLFWNIWVKEALAQVLEGVMWVQEHCGVDLWCQCSSWASPGTLEHPGPGKSSQKSVVTSAELEFHPSVTRAGGTEWCQATDVELEGFLVTQRIPSGSQISLGIFYRVSIPTANIWITCLGLILKKSKEIFSLRDEWSVEDICVILHSTCDLYL